MLDHIPVHFRGVKSVNVVFNISYDQIGGPWVVMEVTGEDLGVEDESDQTWRRWEITNFPPEYLQHLLVFSYFPLPADAG